MTVTPYNFQKPGPLASTLEHQFAGWLKTVCALATRTWQKQLFAGLELKFRASEFDRAHSALAAFQDGDIGYRLVLHERLETMLVWPRSLVLSVVGVLLGDTTTTPAADRDLTLVEEGLFEFFLKDLLLPSFVETWTGRLPIRPVLGLKEVNPRWTRLFALDDSLAVTHFPLRGAFGELEWRWLLPKKGLLECLWRERESEQDSAVVQQRLEASVKEVPVEVAVTLGTVDLPLSELAELRVGDLLVLDQRVQHPLKATVAGQEKLLGWPGRMGNRHAFQVDEWQA